MGHHEPDSEIVELGVRLAGLTITVRGSPSRTADFVRDLADSSLRSIPPPVDTSQVSEPSILSCPGHWLVAAHRLTCSRLSGLSRIKRAWVAGCWARAVGEGRIGSPNQTEAIELPNRYWCVVFCEHLAGPRVFTTSGAFFAAVGRVQGSNTICHGFPSEMEARVYFEASGATYPTALN